MLTLIASDPLTRLTLAERRVAELYASGATQVAIARLLGVSQHTVRNQLAVVYDKLEVHSKVALAPRFPGGAAAGAPPATAR